MPKHDIHATAVIEDGARLGDGVRVGPYCMVGRDVEIGDGAELISHAVVAGHTKIGARTRIFPFASIGHQPQDLKFKGEASTLTVGAECIIREGVTMNPGTEGGGMVTTVGDRCAFLANSHVGHDCRVGNNVIFSNNVMLAGHCDVGDYVIIGGGAAVIQFARVGAHAFLGGMSGLENDLIPYGMALGNRAYLSGLHASAPLRGVQSERLPPTRMNAMISCTIGLSSNSTLTAWRTCPQVSTERPINGSTSTARAFPAS